MSETRRIEPDALRRRLREGGELALLDVREEGIFSRDGHLLYAACVPLGRLELVVDRLVPRRGAPVVVCDGDGAERAPRAAARLAALGYRDVAVLAGGAEAWRARGFPLFTGVNVPSKAFGEFVEHAAGTPSLAADELKARMDAGADLVVLDSRPMDEFHAMCIPAGICCPGAELVHRVADLAPDPATTVVVNCAGRTRSIIGAQSLVNAGIPNPVYALRNGTMGWHLAGLELDRGAERVPPALSEAARRQARARAAAVGARYGVAHIDAGTLARWEAERDARSLYVLDVRSPEEYRAGHRPGSRSAPGGQLVQATDRYAATLGARVVLVDDDGVRATMTASWLRQMGWEDAVVLDGGLAGVRLEAGPEPEAVLGLEDARAAEIAPPALREKLEEEAATLVDLAPSRAFRRGHVAGAYHALRPDLPRRLSALPQPARSRRELVLTSEDGVLARLAAAETDLPGVTVRVLAGGTAAWEAAGLPLVAGDDGLEADDVDTWLRPYDRKGGVESAMKAYLDWEVDLVAQVERDGTARWLPAVAR